MNTVETITDLNTCDKLPIESYLVSPRYKCYTKIAQQNLSPEICDRIPDIGSANINGRRNFCIIEVGKKLRDPQVCNKLSEIWIKGECRRAITSF